MNIWMMGLVDGLGNLVNRFNSFVSGCVNKKMFSQKNNVLLVGPVNSGKSSVFNRLLGFERAIVSNTPGTTRDIISSELFYESSVFSIQDSAGIRETDNKIEGAGIDLSLSQIKSADLVIGIFDLFDKTLIKILRIWQKIHHSYLFKIKLILIKRTINILIVVFRLKPVMVLMI